MPQPYPFPPGPRAVPRIQEFDRLVNYSGTEPPLEEPTKVKKKKVFVFGRLVSYSGTEPLFEEPTKVDKKKFVSKKSNSLW